MSLLQPIPAHGPLPPEPSLAAALYWSSPPFVTLVVAVGLIAWFSALRRIRRDHPDNPVPASRTVAATSRISSARRWPCSSERDTM